MSKLKINTFIDEYKQRGNFYGTIDNEVIKRTEDLLELTLPNSYKWFLAEYGGGGNGFDFSNCEMMLFYRERFPSMPKGFVLIYWCDEFGYCLDTNQMLEGECPVVNGVHMKKGSFLQSLIFMNSS